MELVIFWFALVIATAVWAAKWERNWFLWGILAFFVSPILAGIFLAIAGRHGKRCPQCRSYVDPKALVCRFCRFEFADI